MHPRSWVLRVRNRRTLRAVVVLFVAAVAGSVYADTRRGGERASPPARLHPFQLSDEGASSPQLTVDPAGNVAVAWALNARSESGEVQLAVRPAGGATGRTETVSAPGISSGPSVAGDAAGNLTLLWATGPPVRVEAARRARDGSISSTVRLDGPYPQLRAAPQVAVNARGDAAAAWIAARSPGSDSASVLRIASTDASGAFGQPRTVTSFPGDERPPSFELALDARADAFILTTEADPYAGVGEASMVRVFYRPAGGRFRPPQTLARTDDLKRPSVAVGNGLALDARGDAVASWFENGTYSPAAHSYTSGLYASYRPRAGTWQGPTLLVHGSDCGAYARPAFVGPGDPVVAALVACGRHQQVEVWDRRASGQWGAATVTSSSGDRQFEEAPDIATNTAGQLALVWVSENPADPKGATITAAVRTAHGRFKRSDVRNRPGYAENAQLVLTPTGNSVVVWWTAATSTSPSPESGLGWIDASFHSTR